MKCPVCKNRDHLSTQLRADGFQEGISECTICGAVWSINHGAVELVSDPQRDSFLEAQTESVEGDDYGLAGDDE